MKVQPLTEGKVAQAYPLVRLLHPKLSLEAWQQFSASYVGSDDLSERGILTVEDEQGCIFAMVAYAIDADLYHGRALVAKDVIAATPLDRSRRQAISALFQAIEELAMERQCLAIHTRISDSEPQGREDVVRVSLQTRGHAVDHVVLCKTLYELG